MTPFKKQIAALVPALMLVFSSAVAAEQTQQPRCYEAGQKTVADALHKARGEVLTYSAQTEHGERHFYLNKRWGNWTDVLRPADNPEWACPIGQGDRRRGHVGYPAVTQYPQFKDAYGEVAP